jgi:Tannase-like family of unknown function (DUF6351)
MNGSRQWGSVALRWLVAALAAFLPIVLVQSASAHETSERSQVRITVLSGRADLVSGGSALVALAPASAAGHVHVTVDDRDVTRAFAVRSDGRLDGLVQGLHLGRNVVKATLHHGRGARLTLINHPLGGPVFSGPQLHPWVCQPTAQDAKCDQPPSFRYVYMSSNPAKHGFQAYDLGHPPSDVANTTTDRGVTVPFIVRIETGYIDRDQYQIAALYKPGKSWSAVDPQPQFDHKVLILHGFGCGVEYRPASAPGTVGDSAGDYALGKGYITMSNALDNSSHDCNVAIQAESLLMTKEHLIKTYGTVRYTIGTGCSGGSLAQYWIANAYPGVYQGILPTCSFPDAWTSATQVGDYALLEHYFSGSMPPSSRGIAWTGAQQAAVEGIPSTGNAFLSVGCTNVNPPYLPATCPTGYFYGAVPYWPCAGVSAQQLYNAQTNPGGVRCSIADLSRNLLGPRRPRVWSPQEKQIGHGFAGLPIDNLGVQYGLSALRAGQITPAQFVDMNVHIGGADIDLNPTKQRRAADEPALANAYRTGLINETNNLNRIAIIDCRGPNPGLAHDSYRAFAVRARLDREFGTHASQLIWEGPVPLQADNDCERGSFIAMDRWLASVENDRRDLSLPRKIARDKPADLGDECWDGSGHKVADGLCSAGVVPVYGTPRMVAGDAITTDANKCRLKPLRRSDYLPVQFTDAQWSNLRHVFADGVCDFSRPGVDQQPTIPWQTYQDAHGKVIYGGRPLGPPPRSTPLEHRRRHG